MLKEIFSVDDGNIRLVASHDTPAAALALSAQPLLASEHDDPHGPQWHLSRLRL
jgi:hypothetical protein